jgi:hypothetical protein
MPNTVHQAAFYVEIILLKNSKSWNEYKMAKTLEENTTSFCERSKKRQANLSLPFLYQCPKI